MPEREEFRSPLDPAKTLSGVLGMEVLELGEESARGRMRVTDKIRQPFGFVHGGSMVALAETVTSAATAKAVSGDGKLAFGQEISASLVQSATDGEIVASARRRRAGRSAWVWEVDLTDGEGQLLALVRCTIAVRST